MAQTPLGRYEYAEEGEENWHRDEGPENIFEQQELEIVYWGLRSARPSAGVEGRKYYATDTRALFYDGGDSWSAIGGLGVENTPIPDAYIEHIEAETLSVESAPQDDEDAVRKLELDEVWSELNDIDLDFASDPHGDSAHSIDYYRAGDDLNVGDVDADDIDADTLRVDMIELVPRTNDPSDPPEGAMWFVED